MRSTCIKRHLSKGLWEDEARQIRKAQAQKLQRRKAEKASGRSHSDCAKALRGTRRNSQDTRVWRERAGTAEDGATKAKGEGKQGGGVKEGGVDSSHCAGLDFLRLR